MEANENTTKRKPIPRFISEQYEGGARGFKATKRRQLRALVEAFEELKTGCAYLPGFPHHMSQIAQAIRTLKDELSEKKWGR